MATTKKKTPRKKAADPKASEAEGAPEGKTCETCRWFAVPYKGKTCAQDGLQKTDAACTAYVDRKPSEKPLSDARSDPYVKKVINILGKKAFDLDSDVIVRELKRYLVFWRETKDRVVRPVPQHAENPKTLAKLTAYFEEVQAYHDRVLSIKIDLLRIKRRLDSLWLAAEGWLQKWPASSTLKSERQRLAYLASTFKPLRKKCDEADMLVKMCDMVGDNLTHAHFALREIREATSTYLDKVRQT